MSLPEFPTISPALTREDAINQIISSIAMEELALSHVINAEGEKLQYILGTMPGFSGPQPTIDQVLDVNESVRSVLQSTAETQSVLRSKLQNALSASTMRGPTGPTGPAGEPGVMEAAGFQAEMIDGPTEIPVDGNFMFNQVTFPHPDISYDNTTGVFTLNQTGEYGFYFISWSFCSEGYDGPLPYAVVLRYNGAPYRSITLYYTETHIAGSTIIPADTGTFTIAFGNFSTGAITLPDTGTQAQITILGFKSQG